MGGMKSGLMAAGVLGSRELTSVPTLFTSTAALGTPN